MSIVRKAKTASDSMDATHSEGVFVTVEDTHEDCVSEEIFPNPVHETKEHVEISPLKSSKTSDIPAHSTLVITIPGKMKNYYILCGDSAGELCHYVLANPPRDHFRILVRNNLPMIRHVNVVWN
jgi:hypothetical protein